MNNVDYYKLKYSKYKSKYLELKQKNLEGGLLPKKTGIVYFYIDDKERTEMKDKSFDELCKMSLLVIHFPDGNNPAHPTKWIIPTKGGIFSSWKEKKCNPPITDKGMKDFIEYEKSKDKTDWDSEIKKVGLQIEEDRRNIKNDFFKKKISKEELEKKMEETNVRAENFNKKKKTAKEEEENALKKLFLSAKSCLEKKPNKVYCYKYNINLFKKNEKLEHWELVLTPQDYGT
jgi:hypothetical protein